MNWKQYLFDRDQNLIFVYDQKRNNFLTNQIFVKIANIINNDYLRYGKNININDIFNKWAAKTDNNKSIWLSKTKPTFYILKMPVVQFKNELFIPSGIEFYTCT